LDRLCALPQQELLICTHGAVLAFLMTILRSEPLSKMPEYRHRNTGLCKFFFDGAVFHLQIRDDVAHLD